MILNRTHQAMAYLIILFSLFIFAACSEEEEENGNDILQESVLENAIRIEAVMAHLHRFQEIAMNSMGNRAAGSSAYNECVNYIRSQLADTNFTVQEQDFEVRYFEETEPPVLEMAAPSSNKYTWLKDYITLTYSGSGEIRAEIVFIDPQIPPGERVNSSTDGCEPEDFFGIDLQGKIAVIQRGTCTFRQKVQNAFNAGAAAVLIFNEGQPGRTDAFSASLGVSSDILVPVLSLSYHVGSDLHTLVQNGQTVELNIRVSVVDDWVSTSNVIAETVSGDKNEVIMLGAHLDSVTQGPGINDNGSGSAALLELANQITALEYQPGKTIRFAWWAAEEQGLIGSYYYIEDLYDTNRTAFDQIAMYLNFDMIGSPNYVRGVLDSDQSDINSGFENIPAGAGEIEQTFINYFESRGLPTVPQSMGGTDDVPFIRFGIPSGGLFTGAGGIKNQAEENLFGGTAGESYDWCYHKACDTTGNINQEILLQNTRALANVTEYYADWGDSLVWDQSRKMTHYLHQFVPGVSNPDTQRLHRDRYFRSQK